MDENKYFSTRDIYLATTLICLKFYLLGTDFVAEGDKNRMIGYFRFENTPAIQEAKAKYVQGLLSVEPKTFITNLKSLKSEVSNLDVNFNGK